MKQLNFFDILNIAKDENYISASQKAKWSKALQKYCDTQAQTVGEFNGNRNNCVKAIKALAKKKKIEIDYLDFDFEKLIKKLEEKKREHLFRAKRVDNREWETGSIVVIRGGCLDDSVYIADKMTGYLTPVIPETVGEFTGLCDKNGNKIFEEDIIKVETFWEKAGGVIKTEYGVQTKGITYWSVEHKEFRGEMGFFVYGIDRRFHKPLTWNRIYNAKAEIIGNIHDNPELLEVE